MLCKDSFLIVGILSSDHHQKRQIPCVFDALCPVLSNFVSKETTDEHEYHINRGQCRIRRVDVLVPPFTWPLEPTGPLLFEGLSFWWTLRLTVSSGSRVVGIVAKASNAWLGSNLSMNSTHNRLSRLRFLHFSTTLATYLLLAFFEFLRGIISLFYLARWMALLFPHTQRFATNKASRLGFYQ